MKKRRTKKPKTQSRKRLTGAAVAVHSAAAAEVDRQFMRLAFEQAVKSYEEGGLPIGAVIVEDGAVIAAGHNKDLFDHLYDSLGILDSKSQSLLGFNPIIGAVFALFMQGGPVENRRLAATGERSVSPGLVSVRLGRRRARIPRRPTAREGSVVS